MPRSLKKKSRQYVVKQLQHDDPESYYKVFNPSRLRVSDDQNELLVAIEDLNPQRVRTLLDRGVDPNVESRDDFIVEGQVNISATDIPLHLAVSVDGKGRTGEEREQIVGLLLFFGADPNCKDRTGTPSLHLACKFSYLHAASLLLQAGADVRAVNQTKETALMFMCSCLVWQPHTLEVISLLLTSGCPINATNVKQESALILFARNINHMEESCRADLYTELLRKGANVHAADMEGKTALLYELEQLIQRTRTRAIDCDLSSHRQSTVALLCGGAQVIGMENIFEIGFGFGLDVRPLHDVFLTCRFTLSYSQLRQLLDLIDVMYLRLHKWRSQHTLDPIPTWQDDELEVLKRMIHSQMATVLSLKQLCRLSVRKAILSAWGTSKHSGPVNNREKSQMGEERENAECNVERRNRDEASAQPVDSGDVIDAPRDMENRLHEPYNLESHRLCEAEQVINVRDTTQDFIDGKEDAISNIHNVKGAQGNVEALSSQLGKEEHLVNNIKDDSCVHGPAIESVCQSQVNRESCKRKRRLRKGLYESVRELPLPEVVKQYILSCENFVL